jgi:hypothetical protein
VRERDVLGNQAGGMDENSLVVAFPAFLCARHQLVDLRIEPLAREQARLDRALELALQHVEFPAVDDDLVHLRPAGGIEFAARQRNEG